jgi:8-oxo-dGTP diphosphatase
MTIAVALAILQQGDHFLLQLRDDIPGIRYPGCWGLFGGHLEAGETPLEGLKRELKEELAYPVKRLHSLWHEQSGQYTRHLFWNALELPLSELTLLEGQDLQLVSAAEIRAGEVRSHRFDIVRPLAAPLIHIFNRFLAEPVGHQIINH